VGSEPLSANFGIVYRSGSPPNSPRPPMKLILDNLACERGGRVLFSGLNLDLPAGQGLLLQGPNGAGKTSLLKTIAGLIAPADGQIRLEGGAVEAPVGEQCHLIGHLSGVKRALSVAENAQFWARYLGGGAQGDALERFGLAELGDLSAGLLSAGQARRLALCRLLLAPRPLWLLDEPAESLDAASRALLADLIGDHLTAGGLVVAATHYAFGPDFDQELHLGPSGATDS
jgi:heme exporter protein A